MKPITFAMIVAALLASAGCTPMALRQNALEQVSTLTEFQYRQVLDNLAMYSIDPYTLPSHVRISSGEMQVGDKVDPTLKAPLPPRGPLIGEVDMGLERSVTDNWTVIPVADSNDLLRLRELYQAAVYQSVRDKIDDEKFRSGPAPEMGFAFVPMRHEQHGTGAAAEWSTAAEAATQPSGQALTQPTSRSLTAVPNKGIIERQKGEPPIAGIELPTGKWFDVGLIPPPDAAYVGFYHDRFAWVTKEHREELARFTLLVLYASPRTNDLNIAFPSPPLLTP